MIVGQYVTHQGRPYQLAASWSTFVSGPRGTTAKATGWRFQLCGDPRQVIEMVTHRAPWYFNVPRPELPPMVPPCPGCKAQLGYPCRDGCIIGVWTRAGRWER